MKEMIQMAVNLLKFDIVQIGDVLVDTTWIKKFESALMTLKQFMKERKTYRRCYTSHP